MAGEQRHRIVGVGHSSVNLNLHFYGKFNFFFVGELLGKFSSENPSWIKNCIRRHTSRVLCGGFYEPIIRSRWLHPCFVVAHSGGSDSAVVSGCIVARPWNGIDHCRVSFAGHLLCLSDSIRSLVHYEFRKL